MVGTTEAAALLGITPRRLRYLLQQGRVYGAYKLSRTWVIPLVNGLPKIKQSKRGPKPTWKKVKSPALTYIHINRQLFGKQDCNGELLPVITVKDNHKNTYCDRVVIPGPCAVVYEYDSPRDGARAWIETYGKTVPINPCTFSDIQARIKAVA